MHAVIFDIDGTLLQSAATDDHLYREAVRSVLGKVRFRASLSDYDRVTDSGILQQVFVDNQIPESTDKFAQVQSAFVALIQGHIDRNGPFAEVPGARLFIRRLQDVETVRVGIATGGWQETAVRKLQTAGFDVAGLPLASSDDAIDRREIMRTSLARLDGSFDSITYFGDGAWDRAATRSLGWNFVAVGDELDGIRAYGEAPMHWMTGD